MPRRLLQSDEVARRHSAVPLWRVGEKSLTRTVVLPSFPDAVELINEVAQLAERADHHPDIDLRYRTVTLVLSTHSAGGLTAADFDLAELIDGLDALSDE